MTAELRPAPVSVPAAQRVEPSARLSAADRRAAEVARVFRAGLHHLR